MYFSHLRCIATRLLHKCAMCHHAAAAAAVQSPGDVTLRACAFSTDTGLGSFATVPLAKYISGEFEIYLNHLNIYILGNVCVNTVGQLQPTEVCDLMN